MNSTMLCHPASKFYSIDMFISISTGFLSVYMVSDYRYPIEIFNYHFFIIL